MMRKWTLVSGFAALAAVTWAQPPAAPPVENPQPPAVQTPEQRGRRILRPEQAQEGRQRPERPVKRAATPRADDQLARPADVQADPAQSSEGSRPVRRPASEVPGTAPRPGVADRAIRQAEDASQPVVRNAPNETPAAGKTPDLAPQKNAVETPANPGSSTSVDADAARKAERRERATPSLTPETNETPSSRIPTAVDASPATEATPATTPRIRRQAETPAVESATPESGTNANTPAPGEAPKAATPATKVPADATPFVPQDMPERLRRTPRTGQPGKETPAVTPAGETPVASPTSATETPEVTPATSPTPAETPEASPSASPTPSVTPAASPSPSPSPATPLASPESSAAATPSTTEQPTSTSGTGKRGADTRKAIDATTVETTDLNPAAARLLNREKKDRPRRDPAKVKLTPWVAPETVDTVKEAEALDKKGGAPAVVVLPAGATPTPTPAPERIEVKDSSTIINNINNITIAPTPPPAPTPGPTPVPTPPGVTPVPENFRPDRNWVPYPGWRPGRDWRPPTGWTPPGGWSPPPGWTAPPEWIPRLRHWGWNYIPNRGWVVPVQWAPPPDFVVPPNWYYMPSSAYEDYGFYDPSEVVVMPGRARPDLQVNINVNQVYMPPSPPPVMVMEAPPPPPRPAPPEPPPMPAQVTSVQTVTQVLSRPRNANGPRYQGPVLVTESVHFDFDSYAIKPESFPTLDAVGGSLSTEMPEAIINVEGHTDSDGTDEYNQNLSEQRAWSVKSYLVQKFGLDPNRLIIVGYGERAPISSNASDAGKARNRRVEFENVTELYKAQVVETASPESN